MAEPPTPTLIPTATDANGRAAGDGDSPPPPPAHKPKVKKLRLLLVLFGLGVLAVISTLFGMLISVASDLPSLENKAEYRAAQNSKLFFDDPDDPACKDFGDPCELARLTGNQNRVLLDENQISPFIENAVIAIEDRRFYEHTGVDYKGIARALVQDVVKQRAAQGASTITQQFVKNALSAQGNRSVLQKLREAALAYHLERQWPKQKILTQYLNTVYFGAGAYGVESAMRTYFGNGETDQVDPVTGEIVEDQSSQAAAQTASPAQAALLAGMIASPTMYDPIQNPTKATERRNVVLQRMLEQRMISAAEYREAVRTPVPTSDEVTPPRPDSEQPYFSSWVTQQLVDRYRPGVVFGGGLKIRTTIDPSLQAAAEQAIAGRLGSIGPSSSLVAIENKTGAIKAMVGGTDFDQVPFNLAVNGHRQPGSSIKPFILIRALADGISPDATFTSEPKSFPVPNSPGETLQRRQLRGLVCGRAHAGVRAGDLRQLGLRRARPQGRHQARRADRQAHGRQHAGLDQPGDDARRARGGRDAARDGLRLQHDRQQGPARVRHAGARQGRPGGDRERQGRRHRRQERAGLASCLPGADRRDGAVADGQRGLQRHRQVGGRRGRVHLRQDRHDRELRRRLVRRRQRGPDGGGLGRLPGQAAADADRVPRRAGRRRHLPGRDLPRLHGILAVDPRPARGGRGRRGRGRRGVDPDPELHPGADHAERRLRRADRAS